MNKKNWCIVMETQQTQRIRKDMTIAEILQSFPGKAMRLSEVMMKAGLHCIGCSASTFETLEEGVLGHRFSEEQLNTLVKELNLIVAAPEIKKDSGNFSIQLTKKAVQKVRELMVSDNKKEWGLHIGVLAGGCSGYTYELAFQEKPNESEVIINQEGLKLFIDPESLELLNGVEIDFIQTLNESGFKFNNPNAKSDCGCGKSFS